jgi:hypothetical protein
MGRRKDPFAKAILAPRLLPGEQCEQCRKVTYPTRDAAASAVVELERRKRRRYEAYECPAGSGWHVTTNLTRGGRDDGSVLR